MELIFWVVAFMVLCVPLVWGLADMYACYRFSRTKGLDKTASVWHWFNIKSLLATQGERLIKLFPWLSKDLAEVLGVRPDDGEVT